MGGRGSARLDAAVRGGQDISVVIATFQRPEPCERALRSVLAQTEPPLEVLVCDNGSRDETADRMRAWEQRDARVRFLATAENTGTPGTTRNLGIENARGSLVAFLDDDDEWLPGKLAAQLPPLLAGEADLVSTGAFRSDGSVYFPDAPASRPITRAELLRTNPVIVSSALVRRERLLAAGGFRTDPRVRGIEDYAMWLTLAGGGARLLVLGEPLVRYEDASADRMSTARIATQVAVARLVARHALRRPDGAALSAAARQVAGVGVVLAEAALARRPTVRDGRAG
jgi:glycosyltransferase involved in cell wall biosynthesis